MSDALTLLGLAVILAGLAWLHPALAVIGVGCLVLLVARESDRRASS